MTDAEWRDLLSDLRSLDLDRSLAAVERLSLQATAVDLPRLRRLVVDGEDFYVREAAAAPLARLDGPAALPLLLQALTRGKQENHDNDGLVATIADLLEAHPQAVTPILLALMQSARSEDRATAAWALGWLPPAVAAAPLRAALRGTEPAVWATAAGSLGGPSYTDDPDVLPALTDPDESVRVSAAAALGHLGDRRAVSSLQAALNDPSAAVRRLAAYALQQLR